MNKRRLVKVFIILLLISIMTMLFLYFKDARVKKYMLKCVRIVKAISVYTTNPGKFENLANEFLQYF